FGMLAPLPASLTVATPGGRTLSRTMTATATLADPTNPMTLQSETDTIVLNGRTYTRMYNAATRQVVTTTPAGRQVTATLDSKGRVTDAQVPGLAAVHYTYDTQGHLTTLTLGSGTGARVTSMHYDAKNRVDQITDPQPRTTNLGYDLADRVTQEVRPDMQAIGYGYDPNGNL